MHQFGPPFGSIPMQSAMTSGMIPPTPPPSFPGSAAGSLLSGGGGGGLLSRLFGLGGGASQTMGGLMGSGLSSATGSGMNLTTMLTNAQRIVGLTQQVMPMVQQYGPLIRNMPMIWKIMRSSDSSDDGETVSGNEGVEDHNTSTADSEGTTPVTVKEEVEVTSKPSKQSNKKTTINGIPAPKLYI
ncbi:YqfQ family protein [Halalkalibacter sp. APA_J-10(15)]|uniref:YqfQ family protein n=1 Tax=Halalkalibacter sp. APA_J-10(15) TaxID=2933805 RepID=UPI001FF1BD70|nr:YqfQ family protein [Halalkalibacter sp. APA_J-10(15)]MCK0471546.1 YqfQ family protein [Halalkalibacter sp. APA_J-10(15)]